MSQVSKLYPAKSLSALLLLLLCGQLEAMGTVLAPVQDVSAEEIALVDQVPKARSICLEVFINSLAQTSRSAYDTLLPNSFSATLRHFQQQIIARLRLQTYQFQQHRCLHLYCSPLQSNYSIDLLEAIGTYS